MPKSTEKIEFTKLFLATELGQESFAHEKVGKHQVSILCSVYDNTKQTRSNLKTMLSFFFTDRQKHPQGDADESESENMA